MSFAEPGRIQSGLGVRRNMLRLETEDKHRPFFFIIIFIYLFLNVSGLEMLGIAW